jgi:hypothetical protein
MRVVLVWLALAASSAGVAFAKPCPSVIGIAANGAIYQISGGVLVRRSPAVLESSTKIGCYPEEGPSPTSSVTLKVAKGAPPQKVDLVFALLARSGWPKEKVTREVWADAPHRPVAGH